MTIPPTANEAITAIYDNGIELIKDRVNQLEWKDIERLVAGMFKAMGCYTRIAPNGPDGGRDVIASPGILGFESPRIIVEAQHRKSHMVGTLAIWAFVAKLHPGDSELYACTGGFT